MYAGTLTAEAMFAAKMTCSGARDNYCLCGGRGNAKSEKEECRGRDVGASTVTSITSTEFYAAYIGPVVHHFIDQAELRFKICMYIYKNEMVFIVTLFYNQSSSRLETLRLRIFKYLRVLSHLLPIVHPHSAQTYISPVSE
jgi:hypothetical protein